MTKNAMPPRRMRTRELLPDLHLGFFSPGPSNSLTDVPGVLVHTQSIHSPDGNINTGVTTILPRKDWLDTACYASTFDFNGCGELTGAHWIKRVLWPLAFPPSSLQILWALEQLIRGYMSNAVKSSPVKISCFLPVVGETFDGHLNDVTAFAVKPSHVVHGIESATDEAVKEGNSGGGTGMICHGYKGGTGSSSRVVPGSSADGMSRMYTVAALVQANYGKMRDLRIGGVKVGKELMEDAARQSAEENKRKDGSIIIVLATDAPLHPTQLQRLAKRATVGLGRVGGNGHNSSGDMFLAFSTANGLPIISRGSKPSNPEVLKVEVINDLSIDGLLVAAAEVVEEAIYNALCMAETMVGNEGHKIEALPLDKVKTLVEMEGT